MSNLAFSEYNLVIIRLENVTLYLGQFLNSRISRSSCGTILSYTCISLVIQRLRRHYTLTSLSNYVFFLSTINIASQRRNQQRCQNRQNNQNHDQLYQRKAALLAAALLLQRDHFFHHYLIPPILFLFFYLCKLRRCSAELHILHCRYAGFFVAVTPVFTGISYRRSIMSESE